MGRDSYLDFDAWLDNWQLFLVNSFKFKMAIDSAIDVKDICLLSRMVRSCST